MRLFHLCLCLPLFLLLLAGAACNKVVADPTSEILAVMQAAQDGWNAGDIEAYMQSYWESPELRFAGIVDAEAQFAKAREIMDLLHIDIDERARVEVAGGVEQVQLQRRLSTAFSNAQRRSFSCL